MSDAFDAKVVRLIDRLRAQREEADATIRELQAGLRELRGDNVVSLHRDPRGALELTEAETRCLIELATDGFSRQEEAVQDSLRGKAAQMLAIETRSGGTFGPGAA